MISDGSVGTFCSKIILPASSTTHTDVSFTDTSRPTKCAISSLLPRCSRSPDLDPFIATERDARSASKAQPQPPRYTIFGPGGRQVLDTAEVQGDRRAQEEDQSDAGPDRAKGEHPLAGKHASVDGAVRRTGAVHPCRR